MARRKTGCGIWLMFWIIIILVILLILLQNQSGKSTREKINSGLNNLRNLITGKNEIFEEKSKKRVEKNKIMIKLYFTKYMEKVDKLKLVPVKRTINYTDMPLTKALHLLFEGPTPDESKNGISSVLPGNVKIRGIKIKNRVAYIDLSSNFEYGVGISMLQARLYQVVYTATQFPGVDKVKFLLDGVPKATFSVEGLSIKHPLSRLERKEPIF